eukprot:954288_1
MRTCKAMNQFILRGCTLRNTDWMIGLVVFTGVETKISLNNKESKSKRSNVLCTFTQTHHTHTHATSNTTPTLTAMVSTPQTDDIDNAIDTNLIETHDTV